MSVSIRKFEKRDIPNKIMWINDDRNNKYLHYDLPLEYEKTCRWFEAIKEKTNRYDAVIEVDGIPVGLIGLLSIDEKNRKAEYYIIIGSHEYKGKGIATAASKLILKYGFDQLGLNKIYLFTEIENITAQKLFEKIGFKKEGLLKKDLIHNGRKIDRYVYGLLADEYIIR
jgi:RimJ/RimL family protein N-acetyltransferase